MIGKPLRWRLRRGMKELDVLLERYFERRHAHASADEQRAFAELLEREDPDIWDWVMARGPVPPEFEHVVAELRRHH